MTTKGVALMLQKMRRESNGLGLLGAELVLHCIHLLVKSRILAQKQRDVKAGRGCD